MSKPKRGGKPAITVGQIRGGDIIFTLDRGKNWNAVSDRDAEFLIAELQLMIETRKEDAHPEGPITRASVHGRRERSDHRAFVEGGDSPDPE